MLIIIQLSIADEVGSASTRSQLCFGDLSEREKYSEKTPYLTFDLALSTNHGSKAPGDGFAETKAMIPSLQHLDTVSRPLSTKQESVPYNACAVSLPIHQIHRGADTDDS